MRKPPVAERLRSLAGPAVRNVVSGKTVMPARSSATLLFGGCSIMWSSRPIPIQGGEVAYCLGDGGGVLAQDLGVVARDLRAHLEVRVAGEYWIEHGPRLFHLPALGSEAVAGGQDEPHRAGQPVEDRHAGGGDLVALDVDIGMLVSGHPRSEAKPGSKRKEKPPPAEHLPDRRMACLTRHTDRKGVHAHHPQ